MSDEEDFEGQETDYPDEEGNESDDDFDDFGAGPVGMDEIERLFAEKARQAELLTAKMRRDDERMRESDEYKRIHRPLDMEPGEARTSSTTERVRKTRPEPAPVKTQVDDLTEDELRAFDILYDYYVTVEEGSLASTDSMTYRATLMGLADSLSEVSLKRVVQSVKKRLLTKQKDLPGVRARPEAFEEEPTRDIGGVFEMGMAMKIARAPVMEGSIYGKNITQLTRIAKQYGVHIPPPPAKKPSSRELRNMIKAHIKKLASEYSSEDNEYEVLTKLKKDIDKMTKGEVATIALKYNVLESITIDRNVLTTKLKNKLKTFIGKSSSDIAERLGLIPSGAITISIINTATREQLDALPTMTDQELVNLASRLELPGIIPFIDKQTGALAYTKTNKNKVQLRQLLKQRIDGMIEMLDDKDTSTTYEGVENVTMTERDIVTQAIKGMSYSDVDTLKAKVRKTAGATEFDVPVKATLVDRDAPSVIKYGYFTKYVQNKRGEYEPLRTEMKTLDIATGKVPPKALTLFEMGVRPVTGKLMKFEPLPQFNPDIFYDQPVTDGLRAMIKKHLSRVIHCVRALTKGTKTVSDREQREEKERKDIGVEYSKRNASTEYDRFYTARLKRWIAERLPQAVISDEQVAIHANDTLDWLHNIYGDDVLRKSLGDIVRRLADGKSTEFVENVLRELRKSDDSLSGDEMAVALAEALSNAVRVQLTTEMNRRLLNEHVITDDERNEFEQAYGTGVRVAYEQEYGKLSEKPPHKSNEDSIIDAQVGEYELAIFSLPPKEGRTIMGYLMSALYPFVYLRPELIPFTTSLQAKVRKGTLPIDKMYASAEIDLFPEVYMNEPVSQAVNNRIYAMLSNYIDEIIAGYSLTTKTTVPFPEELERFNWSEHIVNVREKCGESIRWSPNSDIVIAQDDDGSFSCHDVEDLLEQFAANNMINPATGNPFKQDFVERISFRGYPRREVSEVEKPPAPAPRERVMPVFAPRRRVGRRRVERGELREEDRDVAEAELRQLNLTKEALIKAEEKRLKRELTEQEREDLIENEIWTPAYIFADEE